MATSALNAAAQTSPLSRTEARPATITCVLRAAQAARVPANILLAINSVERGQNAQYVRNENGSVDLGHFQINSQHFKKAGVFRQINEDEAAKNGCLNAELAARMLRMRLEEQTGQDYWTRVANYHSYTPKHNSRYRKLVIHYSARWGRWLQRNVPQTVIHNP